MKPSSTVRFHPFGCAASILVQISSLAQEQRSRGPSNWDDFVNFCLEEALIARVRITTGDDAPGPDDDEKRYIVMMDDFSYGEPQVR